MNFQVDNQSNYSVVVSESEKLNALNASELKSLFVTMNKNHVTNIILDLTNTSYCDSSGLSAILTANRLCKDSSGKFVLTGLQPNVAKMIEIAQLHRVLNIEDNQTDAIALINKAD